MDPSNTTPTQPSLTEEGAAALMELLLQRGYFHNDDPPLFLCHEQRYVWPAVLRQEIEQFAQPKVSLICQHFGVSLETLEQLKSPSWIFLGQQQQQLWTQQYLQTALEKLRKQVLSSSSPLLVSHVAKSIWELPLHTTLDLIRKHLPVDVDVDDDTIQLQTLDTGAHVLVSQQYLTDFKTQVLEHFSTLTAPTTLSSVCEQHEWPISWVRPLLQQQAPGVVLQHDDSYVPDAFLQQQQQAAVELFHTVGVVTDAQYSLHQLSSLSSLQLSHALVNPTLICSPLEAALQEANVLELDGWIPSMLSTEDGRLLLQHVTKDIGGNFVWNDSAGVFFSRSMITSFTQHVMPLLVQEYARERAQQLDLEYGAKVILDSILDRKKHPIDYGTLPVERIVQAIRTRYREELSDDFDTVTWNEICEMTFNCQCQNAILAELQRITTPTNISVEFESNECFAYACYLVQMSYNFLQYARDAGMEKSCVACLQDEVLRGPCAHLTWRITQYCLFRDNSVHDFDFGDGCYYKPVDIAVRNYSPVCFSCKTKDPLLALRQTLSGTVGAAMARQWVLCGGDPPSDLDAFRAHVQENCLLLTGLPYKILDKKSEKKFLSARRAVLMERIQSESDPAILLEWTIMLLYQQVKNLVLSGSLLRGPILRLLLQERKITDDVAGELTALAERIERGEAVESDLLERVRTCGLKKK